MEEGSTSSPERERLVFGLLSGTSVDAIDAVLDLLASAGVAPEAVDLIGSHGQTVYHAPHPPATGGDLPDVPVTVQIGSGAIIAARTGITTVHDFRVADLALGGEGAPLVP